MKKYFLFCLYICCATLLFGQKANIFDVFKDKEVAYSFDLQKDTIWIGGDGRLIARAALFGHKIAEWDDANSPLREYHKILGIAKSLTNHEVWMALGTHGVAMKSGSSWRIWKSKEIIKDSLVSAPDIQMIMTTAKGEVFVADPQFKKIAAYQNGRWEELYIPPYDIDNIFHLIRHPQGGVWWVNRYGVFGLQDGNFVSRTIQGQKATDAAFTSNGELIITQYDGWVVRYTGSTYSYMGKIVLPYALAPLLVGVDPSNQIVLLTSNKKIVRKDNSWVEETYSLNPYKTRSLQNVAIGTNDQLWFLSGANKMALFKQSQLTVYKPDLSPGGQIVGSIDGKAIWFRTNEDVLRYDVLTEKITSLPLPPDGVDAFTAGPDNQSLWAHTPLGLQYFDGQAWQTLPIEGPVPVNTFLFRLHTTGSGSIFWVDADFNIKIYQPATKEWILYTPDEDGAPGFEHFVGPGTGDDQGRLWFAGPSLAYLDRQNKWHFITHEKNGLPRGANWKLATSASDGSIWAARNDTLFRYNGREWASMPPFTCAATRSTIVRLHVDVYSRLWVITMCQNNFALQMYDGQQWHTFDRQSSNMPATVSNISEMYNDTYGNIWLQSWVPTLRVRNKSLEQIYDMAGQLDVSPNPARDAFTVNLPPKPDGTFSVYDALGRLCARQAVNGTNETIVFDRSSLPNGIYFMEYQTDYGSVYRQKVILH